MTKVFLSLIFVVSLNALVAQDFAGYILYEYSYVDSTGQDITERLAKEQGREQHYYINGTDYVAFDEAGALEQLYNSSSNQYFFPYQGEMQALSGAVEFPAAPNVILLEEQTTILGYECKALIFVMETGKTTYYYSDEVAIDPEPFKVHRFGNWATYLLQTKGALALKIVSEQEGYTRIMEATKIEQREMKEDLFDIHTYLDKK